jgi:LysM repeat protein
VTSAPPTPTPTPKPRKYRGLTPCPGEADCYIYVVRSGDALGVIADRYGLGLDEVLARNPSISDPGLIVRGQEIRLPTPKN